MAVDENYQNMKLRRALHTLLQAYEPEATLNDINIILSSLRTPECNECTKLEKLIEDGWKVLILCDNCGKLHTSDASLRDLIKD